MTRQKAIATYQNRAKLLIAYKRSTIATNPHKAYRAMELSTVYMQAARNLIAMTSADYFVQRSMWINSIRNNAVNTASAQLSLF